MHGVETHLNPAARERLIAPAVRLLVGDAAFPAHTVLLTSSSGVLASLIKGCGSSSGSETSDFVLSKAGSTDAPEAVRSEQHFETFLQLLYGADPGVTSEAQALALVELAAYFDAPAALGTADAFLAVHTRAPGTIVTVRGQSESLINYQATIFAHRRQNPDNVVWNMQKLETYMRLASQHRLRRLMAVCLPVMWALPSDTAVLDGLDQQVLAALVSAMHKGAQVGFTCTDRCDASACARGATSQAGLLQAFVSGTCCARYKEAHELEWRRASDALEADLLARGWARA